MFGCGDQHGYGDYFCDAMEELYASFAAAGCDMVGHWPSQGYEHSESKVRVTPPGSAREWLLRGGERGEGGLTAATVSLVQQLTK